ncbi:MAG: hypothetical protein MJB14_18545, partial [Spirochaetes bacterium]|nr:hypothetical protein [Spirochaetota bacterium]
MQPDELARKIRDNLLAQRNRLADYLEILENEDSDIREENPDKLLNHIKIETKIIEELQQFKKILVPLESIYEKMPYKKDDTIDQLKMSIDQLSSEVKDKSKENRVKLETLIQKVKVNLKSFNKTKVNQSPYSTVAAGV